MMVASFRKPGKQFDRMPLCAGHAHLTRHDLTNNLRPFTVHAL